MHRAGLFEPVLIGRSVIGGTAAVIGAGPAGLAAAEALAGAGVTVDVYDGMPSAGRKFLLAGKGGLNLTHAEPFEQFVQRYGARSAVLEPWLLRHDAAALRAWARGLGIETFVGSSQRVFPVDMKAAPLLRAWLHRLRQQGVALHMRHRWLGWGQAHALRMSTPAGEVVVDRDAVVLALGGASWPRLGSDGSWAPAVQERGGEVAPLRPSNCGFDVGWSEYFSSRFAGAPVKTVAIEFEYPSKCGFATLLEPPRGAEAARESPQGDSRLPKARWPASQRADDVVDGPGALSRGTVTRQAGEFVVTAGGVEGSLVYAASAALRDAIAARGTASFSVDLLPARSLPWVLREAAHPRGPRSLSTHLKTRLHLSGVKAALLRELVPSAELHDPERLAARIKSLPITVLAARPIDEAISSAGGVRFEALDEHLMLRAAPGLFFAGEMLDWEAPTGGYLLAACLATGRAAGEGAAAWLAARMAA